MKNQHDNLYSRILEEFGPVEPFQPMACYNPDGDCIEFHLTNDPFRAERLDGWFTVYRGEETNEVVGGMVKGVMGSLLTRFPGLRIDIKGNRVALALLLRAPGYSSDSPTVQKTYEKVISQVEDAGLDAELAIV